MRPIEVFLTFGALFSTGLLVVVVTLEILKCSERAKVVNGCEDEGAWQRDPVLSWGN